MPAATHTLPTTADALATLTPILSLGQLCAIRAGLRSEEAAYFANTLRALGHRFDTMPRTYEQDGKGDDATVFLHYFKNGCDWYITERDSEDEQLQAFGLARLNDWEPELGYISLIELAHIGAELDFHFSPRSLRDVRAALRR